MTAFYMKPLYRARQALVGRLLAKPQPKPMTYIGAGAVLQLCEAIAQFGRFPHRNVILGRQSTPEELAFLEDPRNHF